MSKEEGVDPVGSCIGQRGTRVQAVTDELRGERIDIVEFSEDPETFLERAISPAKVKKIEIVNAEEGSKRARVFVDKDQQSIAIGKSGQNVRLASRLTGYEIDIELWEPSEEKLSEKEEKAAAPADISKETTAEPEEDKKSKKASKKPAEVKKGAKAKTKKASKKPAKKAVKK
jgi:N utilization substance protein A